MIFKERGIKKEERNEDKRYGFGTIIRNSFKHLPQTEIEPTTCDVDTNSQLIATNVSSSIYYFSLPFAVLFEISRFIMHLTFKNVTVKCNVDATLRMKTVQKDGVEYIEFTDIDTDITIKDYRIKLEGLFNGDKTLGEFFCRRLVLFKINFYYTVSIFL